MSSTHQESAESATKQPLFRNLDADDEQHEATIIDSVCVNCFKNGETRLLLTKIPFYREVVLMSFKCEHCGFENNELQSAATIQPQGVRYELRVESADDLNRCIVRSDQASVCIPEVELEVPAGSQKGEVSTVEGIIDRVVRGLSQDQVKRRIEHPDVAASIDDYILRLNALKQQSSLPFTVMLDDASGNSFIQNPLAPMNDPKCKATHYTRSKEQDQQLGLYEQTPSNDDHLLKSGSQDDWRLEDLHGEVLQFPTNCPQCQSPCETNMKLTTIPHFKDVVIMATVCDVCGNKTNEVKSGGGIESQGIRFEVRVACKADLTRDVLKSETCSLSLPDLDLEVGPSALNGRFTTVEGILVAMKEQLEGNGIMFHDSADVQTKNRFQAFVSSMEEIIRLERNVTLVLDDPAGNSYIQSLSDDGKADENLKIVKYERNYEQNEELGLNDIKTENYEALDTVTEQEEEQQ